MPTRAQIELWMLTKMAMLFFIVSLALVMTSFAGAEKKVVCSAQAQAVARSIGGSISQVVNAPAEDERKVLPLEPALSLGASEFSRYVIYLSDHVDRVNQRKFISVTVQGRDKDCVGADSAAYPVSMVSGTAETPGSTGLRSQQVPVESGLVLEGIVCACRAGTFQGEGCRLKGQACLETAVDKVMQVFPSLPIAGQQRAYYLVALKCQEKQITPGLGARRHLFVEACIQPRPQECIDFTSGDLRNVCDWPAP